VIAANNLHAENIDHILINEIQISGESANDEFIELYNPTSTSVDLNGWSLKKITSNGSNEYYVTSNIGGIIPASGYFLIVPRAKCGETGSEACYKGTVEKDAEYTTSNYLAKDNAILLYDRSDNLVDKVGWGDAMEFEGAAFGNSPENSQSMERKVDTGIMRDTDNNKDDFILQVAPTPKNTKSVLQNTGDSGSVSEGGQTNDQNQESANENNETQNNGSSSGSSSSSSGFYAQSYSAKIVITEFLPNPEDSDNDNEFIEVYNAGTQDENVGGWTMDDKMGKTRSYSIPENVIIRAGEYKVFMSSETRIVLNNSGDGIVLKNAKGEKQDETPVSGAANEDVSYALKDDGIWAWTKKPTPGAKNIIEMEKQKIGADALGANKAEDVPEETVNYDYSDGIILTEVLPDPEGSDNKLNYEWIEIYNDSTKEVNLRGWTIDDIQGKGSKPYIINEDRKIKPKEYLVFSKEETNVILNNTADEVNIIWPDGSVEDSISYKKPKEGFSYALLDSGKWNWTSKPSPGKENLYIEEDEKTDKGAEKVLSEGPGRDTKEDFASLEADAGYVLGENTMEFIETDIDSAKKLPRFSDVKISGIVSAPPGIFQDNLFYISGSGLQVFSYSRIFGGIRLGDKLEIFGKMSEVGGEKRLVVESPDFIKIISHDNLLEPELISTGEAGEQYEGYLVLAEGSVMAINGDIFYIDDGSGQAKVYVKPGARIKKPDMKIGDSVNVTGIVSRTSLGYRVLPRFQNDIRIGKTSGVSSSEGASRNASSSQNDINKSDRVPFYYYGFILAALIVLIDWGRMKVKK